jgi:membrane-bound serine protease (ClpP class)
VALSIRFVLVFAAVFLAAAARAQPVHVVPLEGAIGPASADFARRSIERAAQAKASLVILRIDTPGGLDTSMREIIKAILASPIPVAAFVAPSGARAASAGTFILYAAHVAAMAPGTNLGAASPVSLMNSNEESKKGDTMTRKVTNDAVAYIRGLAELRKRNADWAEKAVREGVSLPAAEALKMKVIEHVAADVPALLKALGREGAQVTQVEPDWRTRVLAVVTNPSVAYLLLLVGIYALVFEFLNPGLLVPGIVGAIALLLALYALHLLPVNYAGLALIVLGLALMAAELFLPSFGALGIGGIVAFVFGSVMLIEDTALPGFDIPYPLIGGVAAGSALLVLFVGAQFLRARRRAVVAGREQMIGARAEALEDFSGGEGWALVHGERWKVRAAAAVRRGDRLRITAIRGLVLDAVRDEGDPP